MPNTVNCLIVDDEALARDVIASHLGKIEGVEIIAECSNALEAFREIQSHKIDLVFLDINMPEITGISFAKSINKDIKIIFTTAYRDYAVEGFELRAVDYLLKPISFERLLKSLNSYFEVHKKPVLTKSNQPELDNQFLFIRSNRKMVRIDFSSIIYIESLSDYIRIHTKDKNFVTRETISSIENKLPMSDFLRIHRSFIVSIKSIDSYTHEFASISGKSLSISRTYKDEVLERLKNI